MAYMRHTYIHIVYTHSHGTRIYIRYTHTYIQHTTYIHTAHIHMASTRHTHTYTERKQITFNTLLWCLQLKPHTFKGQNPIQGTSGLEDATGEVDLLPS